MDSHKSNEIESMIESDNFHDIIDHFKSKLSGNDDENSSDNSDYDSDEDDTILDNYLLNRSGENIADILTKINDALELIASKM